MKNFFTVFGFSGTRNPGGGGGGGIGMLNVSELVEVTFFRWSASASRLLDNLVHINVIS